MADAAADRSARACYAAAAFLIVSGVCHLCIWLVDGSSLAGDTSWRKPILFGFSAGVTVLSVGWLSTKLRPRFGDRLLMSLFAMSMLVEVGLISMQTWRGVPSHFNRATRFDALVLTWIESLILFATVVICYLAVRAFGELSASRDMQLAIRGGMGLLVFACLFGFVMVGYGNVRVAAEQPPGIYGERGVMKFPHGMPIHAIQLLPLLAWAAARLGVNERLRYQIVGFALTSIIAFTLFSLFQTFGGRARFEWSPLGMLLLILSAALLVPPVVIVANSRVDSGRTR